ncbi:type III-A CRISPR-associated protein Cas10/Csm1 [Thermotoga sp. SG1]|uniref:type III-A CRISPR-associated protein Cas10/Csm1 n=1 Tax=Thermotoga sp. SG1 TaxID=126739 RepID=UPI000C778ABF|nr:type III-A CRISPR-associated protein Cas10/Csm1 [Thermotoga sp. SG1]PLV57145.1 type III-A CRISPR-associated protein Cas10/Csm1 [Thermotoga sp. SG1]
MSDTEREEIVLGALIHDVGKVVRRAEKSAEKHQLAGYDFTNKAKKFAKFQKYIHYHHEKDLKEKKLDDEKVWYVCFADNLSSSERMTEGGRFNEHRRIENLLSKIPEKENARKPTYFPVKSADRITEAVTEMEEEEKSHIDLYESFVKDAEKITLSPDDVNFLVYKYFSFIPQETKVEGDMDISLYDHLKVTAMLAISLYDYAKENNLTFRTYDEMKNYFKNPAVKPFLLVGGDVSGIQNFIASVSSKGALRSYRGRSFFIEILQEVVVDEILERTGFYRTNVHFIGGGHFYIVLSNTEKVKKALEGIRKELNAWFRKKGLSLHLVMEYTQFSANDVSDMKNIFDDIVKKVNLRKLRMYTEEDLEELFPDDLSSITERGSFTCKVCGNRVEKLFTLGDSEEEIACDFCREMYELGKDLLKKDHVYIVEKENGKFEIFDKHFEFSKKPEKGAYKIRDIYQFSENEENVRRIQVITYFEHQEFEEIAKEAPGKKIASLLVDVDNLGRIFRDGLKRKTLSRYSTLSRLMSFFFKERVEKIVEGKNVMVIYSGGDDLYLVGGWNDVLDVAKQLREEFSKFTTNDFITFSAGYVITDEKTSMRLIREMSERAESSAKRSGKNSIAFSSKNYYAVSWEMFFKMYEVYSELKELATKVDRSVIRKALKLTQEDTPLNRAFLAYIEARENKEEDKRVASLTREKLEELGEDSLNVILQFVDLLARKKEG